MTSRSEARLERFDVHPTKRQPAAVRQVRTLPLNHHDDHDRSLSCPIRPTFALILNDAIMLIANAGQQLSA
jgi:hypothetical protein